MYKIVPFLWDHSCICQTIRTTVFAYVCIHNNNKNRLPRNQAPDTASTPFFSHKNNTQYISAEHTPKCSYGDQSLSPRALLDYFHIISIVCIRYNSIHANCCVYWRMKAQRQKRVLCMYLRYSTCLFMNVAFKCRVYMSLLGRGILRYFTPHMYTSINAILLSLILNKLKSAFRRTDTNKRIN